MSVVRHSEAAFATQIATAPERLEQLRAATKRTTVLLKERLAALIVAAVTGQIDIVPITTAACPDTHDCHDQSD